MTVFGPLHTSNAVLAFALNFAGVPFCEDTLPSGKKVPLPLMHVYDEEILKNLGYAGETLIDGARAAFAAGKQGQVEYALEPVENMKTLVAAFDDQQDAIKREEGTAGDMAAELMRRHDSGHLDAQEALVRLACVALKSSKLLRNEWKNHKPYIRVKKQGATETTPTADGGKIEKRPGWVMVPIDADEATRRKLRI